MFWCDMLGTLTFIYDLSYINSFRAAPDFVGLEVKEGFPVSHIRYVCQIDSSLDRVSQFALATLPLHRSQSRTR